MTRLRASLPVFACAVLAGSGAACGGQAPTATPGPSATPAQTEWTGTPGSWVLIVNHYLYFSAEWELDIEWHVMVPPDDWSRIYLRKRFAEVAPSVAFEISSVAGATAPHEIEPPEAMWR